MFSRVSIPDASPGSHVACEGASPPGGDLSPGLGPERNGERKARKKWVRKAPMISAGARRPDCSLVAGSMTNRQIMFTPRPKKNAPKELYGDLCSKFASFLSSASTTEWGPDEQHRRFYIFGEYINCVRWEGKFYITGPDVFKVQNALYRLENCTAAPQKRRFEETILTQLRAISEEAGMRIEPSGSPFINLLYGLGAVRTRKRQKVFEWDAVQHEKMFESRRKQAGRAKAPPPPSKFVLKSFEIFERPKLDVLMDAIEMVEVANGEETSKSDSLAVS